ncbi:MAG: nucleotide exchange factor GrpE [Candidatus Taylorbacteria bacterium]|nr:nucleotide exchange factor GrpE [Candidatus Taylorbacteria bacterium]
MTDRNLQDDTKDLEIEPENPSLDDTLESESDVVIDEEAEMATPQIVKSLREKLKKAVEEKQEYLTGWQKDKAEFINARRRDEESKQEFLKFANQGVIEELLPVMDSFDMAMANKTAWESVSKEWRSGMEGVYTQLVGVLQKHGATGFGAVGDKFDPNLHHSIGLTETPDASFDDTVSEVMQKGYTVHGKVIRPALVKVFEVKK